MAKIETSALISHLNFECSAIKTILDRYVLAYVEAVSVLDGISNNLTNGHLDEINLVGIAACQKRQVSSDVLNKIAIFQTADYLQLNARVQ